MKCFKIEVDSTEDFGLAVTGEMMKRDVSSDQVINICIGWQEPEWKEIIVWYRGAVK